MAGAAGGRGGGAGRRRLTQAEELAAKLSAGSVAGVIGISACYPIDMAKVRLQRHPQLYTGVGDVLRQIYRSQGVVRWYDGLRGTLMGVIPEKGIKLAAFDFSRTHPVLCSPDGSVPLSSEMIAALFAAWAQVFVATPLERVKIQSQIKGLKPTYIIRRLGVRGLYQGYWATLSRDCAFNIVFFPVQSLAKSAWTAPDDNGGVKFAKSFACGIGAAMLGGAVSCPFDVVKTRLQAETMKGGGRSPGMRNVIRMVHAGSGASAFMAGVQPRVYQIAPMNAIQIATYDLQKRLLIGMGFDMPT